MNNKSIVIYSAHAEYYLPPENPNSKNLVIAADGGYAYLKSIDITPDIVIGDFDSLGYVPCEVKTIALPAEKDVTDTAAAIETGWSKGYRVFCIYGGTRRQNRPYPCQYSMRSRHSHKRRASLSH